MDAEWRPKRRVARTYKRQRRKESRVYSSESDSSSSLSPKHNTSNHHLPKSTQDPFDFKSEEHEEISSNIFQKIKRTSKPSISDFFTHSPSRSPTKIQNANATTSPKTITSHRQPSTLNEDIRKSLTLKSPSEVPSVAPKIQKDAKQTLIIEGKKRKSEKTINKEGKNTIDKVKYKNKGKKIRCYQPFFFFFCLF